MKDILAEIVEKKRDIVAEARRKLPLEEVKRRLQPGHFRMGHVFRKGEWNLIAECKLQSPAKGRLDTVHTVEQLAHIYEDHGASMLSVHTDPHFLGCNEDFVRVRQEVRLPLLRKDFIIDAYQIYEARMLGADAVLLIARILSREQLKEYLYTAWSLGMDALIEVHDEADMKAALATPAQFIGINNRNLVTFRTDIQQTLDLLPHADLSRVLISESGIFSAEDAGRLRDAGCDGILVGEGLVRSKNIGQMTSVLSGIA
ncbi:indole-3-glycerol phosphate synthase TrpC [Selenomonas montiformis]|uniref:indole-3-glycerol-phosphate synthase n=1 Tax=Selenomonas montiformis TaxID=2652285 RepID=A0A6I2UXI3_9FIRM|nr:indole-3-glycerol phosphate synthase TrpC [Selenomonas montiformis]MDY4697647.1 indole-3-glycerol phosphate synthase TrpC [Selenomonas montiformis]MSV23996.1 indole-3-glycerol phosphate synthase TrpC [Selenomonas montiformis]